jgi:hypothetical protein
MNLKNKTNLICLGESELLQWTARKRIFLLKDRIFQELPKDENDLSFFASSSFFKLDDAKARVIVKLKEAWLKNQLDCVFISQKNFAEIHLDQIQEVAPVLDQYRRRLEDLDLPIANWSADEEWNLWLIHQGAHERASAISECLYKLGFTSNSFLENKEGLEILTRNALRPKASTSSANHFVNAWSDLISKRDELLKKMRFEGHSGRTSFFIATIKGLTDSTLHEVLNKISPIEDRENDWNFSDISPELLSDLQALDRMSESTQGYRIPTITKAAYIRIFDEINYGQKNWSAIFNLIRFIKYSVDTSSANFLIYLTLACLPTEEIYKLDVSRKYYS